MARTGKTEAKRPAKAKAGVSARKAAGRRARVTVRMYRHGLGDCFLVTLPRGRGAPFRLMIDCGVLLGTPDGAAKMQAVVADIAAECGGRIDLLLVTHEHWDHVSGFIQARDAFAEIEFGAVWMGWTESPDDPQARKLTKRRAHAIQALRLAGPRLALAGAADAAAEIEGLLGFFGAGGKGGSTSDALEVARGLGPKDQLRYADPADPPVALQGTGARIYVLGPPRDETLLFRSDPSRRTPETYDLALDGLGLDAAMSFLADAQPDSPFGPLMTIPMEVAQSMPAFQRYFADGAGEGEAWRRIDGDWLGGATELALKLDSDTNNTSLAVAIELADGEVLLFAADAQVGNWLSWQDLAWTVGGRKVTGPDLLERTVFYKVGHHGSHNATLRAKGLEQMTALRFAAIPVDEVMAKKKRWNAMPLDGLVAALTKHARVAVVRADEGVVRFRNEASAPVKGLDDSNTLYFEFTL